MPNNTVQTFKHSYGVDERIGAERICTTEPEEKAMLALRHWTHAQIVPELRAELQMWDSLDLATDLNAAGLRAYIDNHPDYTDEEKALFIAIAPVIAILKEKIRKRVEKSEEGKKATHRRRRITKGGTTGG